MILLKSPREIRLMREAGRLVAQTHAMIREALRPGLTTGELDTQIDRFIRARGGIPSFKGYGGYPANACISVNEELVHGIPGPRRLDEGDIVSVDVGVFLQGFHGDSAWSYSIGTPCPEVQRLLDVTEQALYAGIEQARVGQRLADISETIQRVAEGAGFHIPRRFVGHGIGRQMHEEPSILNYWDTDTPRGPRLWAGMTFAIEPMVQVGTAETITLSDGWTARSADNSLSAHFEHTIAITPDGPLILTRL